MPESIDWPPPHPPRRRRRRFLLIMAVLVGIVFGGRSALSYYVDVLWFGSLGDGDVFWKTLSLEWGIFARHSPAARHVGPQPRSRASRRSPAPKRSPVP